MKRTTVWACVALLFAGFILVAGCGGSGGGGGGGTPQDTVKKFLDSNISMDVDALWGTLTKESQKTLDKAQMKDAAAKQEKKAEYTYKIGKTNIKGDTATVEAALTEGTQSFPVTFNLMKEGGSWKIDFLKTFGGGQTGEQPAETTPSTGTTPPQ